jgi:hypothetical protein
MKFVKKEVLELVVVVIVGSCVALSAWAILVSPRVAFAQSMSNVCRRLSGITKSLRNLIESQSSIVAQSMGNVCYEWGRLEKIL